MASILDLSPEILLMCFGYLYDHEQGRPLFSLRCLRLHLVASELLFHNVNLNFSNSGNQVDHDTASLLAFLHNDPRVRASVRTVTILSDLVRGPFSSSRYFAHDSRERMLPLLLKLQPAVSFVIINGRPQQPRLPPNPPPQALQLGTTNTNNSTCSLQQDPSIQDRSVFQALLPYRSLRHFRLLIRSVRSPDYWNFSTTDAIYTYLYYCTSKVGCKLESLYIHSSGCSEMESGQSWTIFEMGDRKLCVSNGPSQQIWDVSVHKHLKLLKRFQRRFTGYHHSDRLFEVDNDFRFSVEWSKNLSQLC